MSDINWWQGAEMSEVTEGAIQLEATLDELVLEYPSNGMMLEAKAIFESIDEPTEVSTRTGDETLVIDRIGEHHKALYVCYWGNDYMFHGKVDINTFDFFNDGAGYSNEDRELIWALDKLDTTRGTWQENHYIMRVQ